MRSATELKSFEQTTANAGLSRILINLNVNWNPFTRWMQMLWHFNKGLVYCQDLLRVTVPVLLMSKKTRGSVNNKVRPKTTSDFTPSPIFSVSPSSILDQSIEDSITNKLHNGMRHYRGFMLCDTKKIRRVPLPQHRQSRCIRCLALYEDTREWHWRVTAETDNRKWHQRVTQEWH